MNPDVCIVIGIVLAIFSVPSMMSAFIDRRSPMIPLIVIVVAAGLIVWAVQTNPGVYSFKEIPHVFVRVAAKVL